MQTTVVTDLICTILGQDALGIYLYGSSVDGGVRPHSDIDIFVVSRRPTTPHDKQRLATGLLEISKSPRPVEVTIVVQSDIRPWQYPPRF